MFYVISTAHILSVAAVFGLSESNCSADCFMSYRSYMNFLASSILTTMFGKRRRMNDFGTYVQHINSSVVFLLHIFQAAHCQ